MALLVRVLRDKSWLEVIDPSLGVNAQNVRGDAAGNFCSEVCRVSFFKLDDKSEAEKIALAVAALRPALDDVDYCFMELEKIEELGCRIDDSVRGETPFPDVNAKHVDVCDLNLPRLLELSLLAVEELDAHRIRGKAVRKLMKQAVDDGVLDPTRLKPGLLKALA